MRAHTSLLALVLTGGVLLSGCQANVSKQSDHPTIVSVIDALRTADKITQPPPTPSPVILSPSKDDTISVTDDLSETEDLSEGFPEPPAALIVAEQKKIEEEEKEKKVSTPLPTNTQVTTNIKIPILVYHHIREHQGWSKSTWSWKMTVSPAKFDEQLQWLTDRGYTTINMDTLVQIVNGEIQGPSKPVVITFDDNQMNSYENGFPLLKKHGHRATFYLVSNRLDNAAFIGRSHIPELMEARMDIQSHTATHANLTNLSPAEIQWQLRTSKEALEAITDNPVRHVAYPLTAHNQTVRNQLHSAGYVTGSVMDPRPVTKGANFLKLPRIMMTDETNLEKVLP